MNAPRLEYGGLHRANPVFAQALGALTEAAVAAGFSHTLLELMKLRVSQINGCAFCLQYHTNLLVKARVDPAKLAQLAAWREASIFTDEECAALDYAEALTASHVPDEAHDHAAAVLGADRLPAFASAVVAINGWNRLAVAFRFTPPPHERAAV